MDSSNILEINKLTQQFKSGDKQLTVLDSVSFSVAKGTVCSIVGPSGSGKTTLLGLCAGLDRPTSGQVILNGINIGDLNEDERAAVRNDFVGFVFQTFQLIPTLTALENVMVPLELRGEATKEVNAYAKELLTEVGLGDRLNHYPTQLSGGEQQRVAIARAFINKPQILFADEPTGNLDTETGETIENLIFDLNRASGTTLVIVTHDLELAHKCDRVIQLRNGKIASDEWIEETATAKVKEA
ncbi:ABC transporter ATP-binding protein [Aliifodinibius sp. S!AR15-10]|uniref:ABC transporter ATP-binding protein n=1 Tax=Aliifodinibius sp. S!AR15-10 TaxID=2950437 RepID=UPI002861F71D|nr:ABC transporter ATP-binding protein [Aliifodinibius sp. S!AR15-10]MDR8390535.1 ABC transporter ATP-binding protein [Aliifodinibius sp. S!AR15-10]